MYNSVFKPGLFQDQIILITGGGSGIGRVLAFELSTLKATVIITGRQVDKLQQTASKVKESIPGAQIDYFVMDIRQKDQVDTCIAAVLKKYGRIDSLVNNAGGQFASPAAMISDKGWRAVIDTNINGTWNVIRSVFDQCMASNGGSIVTVIADMWNGFPFMSHTGAARAAVENLTKSLCLEWSRNRVRLNCVAPGLVIGNGMNNYPDSIREQVLAEVSWKNPSGRMATEDEISAAIVFLLSPAAAYINGTTLRVDGGSSLAKASDELFDRYVHMKAYVGMSHSYSNPQLNEAIDKMEKIKPKL